MRDEALHTRLATAEASLDDLRRELAELRVLAERPTDEPEPAAPADDLPWWEQSEPPMAEPEPIPELEPPLVPPDPPRLPPPPREPSFWDRDISFADLIGPKAFAIAGGIVTLLGVVFFFVLAANRGWIGPELRVLLGGAASALVFAGGLVLRRRDAASYSSLAAVGAGIAGAYVTLASATVLYGLVPSVLALAIAAGVAGAGVAIALAWSSQLVAALGLLGAIGAPALLALDEGMRASGAAFVAIVFAAAAVVAIRNAWGTLLVTAATGSVAQAAWLVVVSDGSDVGAVAVVAAFAAILLATGVAAQLRGRFADATFSVGFVLAAATFAGYAARSLFTGEDLGIALAIVAVVFCAVAAVLFARGGVADLSILIGALALTFGAVAAAQLLSGQSLAIAWAAQAAILAWLARAIDEPRYQLASFAHAGLALGHVVAFDAPLTDLLTFTQHPALGVPSVVAVAAAFAAIAWLTARRQVGIAAALLVVYAASLATLELTQALIAGREGFEWGHVAISAIAAGAALLACVLGRQQAGAVVAAVVLAKVVAFDVDTLAEPRAGWSKLALATALFLMSVLSAPLAMRIAELALAATLAASASVALLDGDDTGFALLALALPFAAVGARELRRVRDYASVGFALALLLAAAGSAMVLDGSRLVVAWSAAAAALPALALLVRESRFVVAGHLFAAAAVAYAGVFADDGYAALALAAGLFLAGVGAQHGSTVSRAFDPVAVAEVVLSAAFGVFAAVELLGEGVEGFGVLATAFPFALVGALELARRRDFASVHFALAAVVLGVAAPMLLDGNWLVLGWATLAVGLAAASVASREPRFLIGAHAYGAIAIAHALGVAAPPRDLFVSTADPGSGVPAVVLAAAAALVVASVFGRDEQNRRSALYEAGLWIAGGMGVYALSLSLLQLVEWISPAGIETDFQRGHVAVSASWAVVGLLLLYRGLRDELTRLRVAGLILFGVSLAKLFLYDLTFLTSITRAFSFLAVGALLLLAGFFYQRLVRSGDSAPA